MEEFWVKLRELLNLVDSATVKITGLRDAEGNERIIDLQIIAGLCVRSAAGPAPVEEGEEGPRA